MSLALKLDSLYSDISDFDTIYRQGMEFRKSFALESLNYFKRVDYIDSLSCDNISTEGFFATVWDYIKRFFKWLWEKITGFLKWIWNLLTKIGQWIAGLFKKSKSYSSLGGGEKKIISSTSAKSDAELDREIATLTESKRNKIMAPLDAVAERSSTAGLAINDLDYTYSTEAADVIHSLKNRNVTVNFDVAKYFKLGQDQQEFLAKHKIGIIPILTQRHLLINKATGEVTIPLTTMVEINRYLSTATKLTANVEVISKTPGKSIINTAMCYELYKGLTTAAQLTDVSIKQEVDRIELIQNNINDINKLLEMVKMPDQTELAQAGRTMNPVEIDAKYADITKLMSLELRLLGVMGGYDYATNEQNPTTDEWTKLKPSSSGQSDSDAIKMCVGITKFANKIMQALVAENELLMNDLANTKRLIKLLEPKIMQQFRGFTYTIAIPQNVTDAMKEIFDYAYAQQTLNEESKEYIHAKNVGDYAIAAKMLDDTAAVISRHTKFSLKTLVFASHAPTERGPTAYAMNVLIPYGVLFHSHDPNHISNMLFADPLRRPETMFNFSQQFRKIMYAKLSDRVAAIFLHEFKHAYDFQNGAIQSNGVTINGQLYTNEREYRQVKRESSADLGAVTAFQRRFEAKTKLITDFIINALKEARTAYANARNSWQNDEVTFT